LRHPRHPSGVLPKNPRERAPAASGPLFYRVRKASTACAKKTPALDNGNDELKHRKHPEETDLHTELELAIFCFGSVSLASEKMVLFVL
jgi:hypothetical protein